MYDIIGDVHGHAALLKKMLFKLGYKKSAQGYFHPKRKVIFVGDFINRGPEIRKTIRLVRTMVENGNAFAILGNHEINAIIYYLKDKNGLPLVKPSHKNFLSLIKTRKEFSDFDEEWKSHRNWLRTLPLYLDLENIRIVHACWSERAVRFLDEYVPPGKMKKKVLRKIYKNPNSELAKNIWLLTKGVNFKMPGDLKVINNKGVFPRSFRMRWWERPNGKTFEEMSFESKFVLPDYTIPKQIIPQCFTCAKTGPIIFFGHYCRFKGPHIIKPNICCVDSCVTGSKTLTAYRWKGEKLLNKKNLIQIRS